MKLLHYSTLRQFTCAFLAVSMLWTQALHAQSGYAYGEKKKGIFGLFAQNDNQNQPSEKHTLFNVLKDLNKQKGVYFLFSDPSLGNKQVNAVTDMQAAIDKILDHVLKNTGLKYKKVSDNAFVILTTKENSKKSGLPVNFQQDDQGKGVSYSNNARLADIINGRVTTGDGKPVSGASITIKGTTRGTTTNSSGDFSIEANRGEILVISSIGFTTQEMLVGDDRSLTISLEATNQQMTEVVVTALGIKKQSRSVGYSTTQVPGSNFTQSRETNLGNALTGQIAGVNVAGTATGPAGSSRVMIRGNASLAGNNQPLYVIDGIPFDNTNQGGTAGQWGGADFGDGLSTINPDDIETIQVLKGVAASALYGYRGGNGAILITTKSGARNKGLGLEVNNNLTFNKVIDEREYQYTYGQGTQGVKPNSAAGALAVPNFSWGAKLDGSQAVNFLGDTYAYTGAQDNFKNFYKTGVTNQSSIALTGGNEKGHFRLGLSNLYMTTVIPNSNMKQQGVNFNSTYDVTPRLHMSLTANYVFEKVKNRVSFSDAPGNVVASALYLGNSVDIRWLQPAVKADGSELLPGTDIYFNNPYFVAYRYQNTTDRNRLTAGLTMKYDILKWLSAQAQVTRDGYIFDVVNIVPTGTGYSPGGSLTQYTIDYHELNGNFSLEANKQLGDVALRVVGGGNSQDNVNKIGGMGAVPLSGQGPAGPFKVPFFYSSSNISEKPYAYYYAHYRVNSLYASADVGFRNYLFLTLTARNDWFSTLNKNSNNILYPSISTSFVFSDVMNLPSWISFGKLRASYAQSSNGTRPYRNLLTYSLLGYTIGGQSLGNITQTEIPNNFLKPISIKEQEIGINVQFLGGRAGIDLAVYNKKTEDDILGVTISPTSGYTGNVVNIGELRNRGVEVLLTGTPVKLRDFSWNVSFNIARNNNKVLALSEGTKDIVIEGAFPRWGNGVSVKNIVGLPFAQIVGYAYLRDSSSGQIIYGTDGLPLHTSQQVPLGSGIYKTTGGLSNQFKYKNFSLSFLIDFKYGAKIYSGTNLLLYNYGLHENTLQGREGGYVGPGVNQNKQPNQVSVPAQIYFQAVSTGASHVTEEFVYDASFIKLRAVSIGFDLPEATLRKTFIKGLNISLVARNLATLMKHTPNIDPESNLNNTNAQGLELSGYPGVRSLGFNLNVKF